MTPGILLLLAVASLVVGIIFGPWFSRIWLAFTLTGAAAGLACGR